MISQDDTLGNIMEQMRDPVWRANPTFGALEDTLLRIESLVAENHGPVVLVERFHLTAYALYPRWRFFKPFDKRLCRMNAVNIFLSFPDAQAEQRSIERPERAQDDWAGDMDAWYGSRKNAVRAARLSQSRRRKALSFSKLPFLHLDTGMKDWTSYADTISAYLENAGPVSE